MLDLDEFLLLGLDQADRVVAVLAVVFVAELLGSDFPVVGRGVHGDEVIHLVAAVDIEHLADRAQAMGRIVVSPVVDVVVHAPGFAPVPILGQEVDVGAFHVIYFAEESMLGHVQGGHLKEVVAAVLEHHAVTAGFLAGVHQLPAIFDRHGRRDLYGDMMTVLHGIYGDRNVVQPVRRDVDQVDVIPFAQLFVGICPDISVGSRQPGLVQNAVAVVHAVLFLVAESHDLDPVDLGVSPDGSCTP